MLSSDRTEQLSRAHRLGELIDGFPERLPGALPALQELLEGAADDEVLAAAIDATGLAADHDEVLGLLVGLDLEHHDNSRVRAALVQALAGASSDSALADAVAETLALLTADSDGEIRDWACFGLGRLGSDSPAIREALVARLADDHTDARCEALAALARFGDRRVVPVLQRHFEEDDPFDVFKLELTAAAAIADPSLLAGLLRVDAAWQDDRPDAAPAADAATSEEADGAPIGGVVADAAEEHAAHDVDDDDEADLFAELDRAIAACRTRD